MKKYILLVFALATSIVSSAQEEKKALKRQAKIERESKKEDSKSLKLKESNKPGKEINAANKKEKALKRQAKIERESKKDDFGNKKSKEAH